MALRQMGLANEIINIAFGVLLGAIAVAVALAFGLGARDVAGRAVERWVSKLEDRQ
jgi:ABC-type Fe3+ transport system permease subunit